MVLHYCKDLMLVAKVSSWAKANEVAYKSAGSAAKFEAAIQEGNVQCVVVDLQVKSLDVEAIVDLVKVARASNQSLDIRLFGYAQHVMTDLIDTATKAGFDRVLTRGQFDHGFADLIA